MNFEIFVGIDQTGAVQPNGKPKPLQVSIIDCSQKNIMYYTGLKIKKLCYEEINILLNGNIKKFKSQNTLICIDTVFGLPQSCDVTIKTIFKTAHNYSLNGSLYGAQVAFRFFNQYAKNKEIPAREVEKLVGANSVFKLQPYQKNIGCGSYRIIKELSNEKKWFNLWPFDSIESKFTICEGYPSYFWKNTLGLNTRNLIELKKRFNDLTFKNSDSADSFVLAYGAMNAVKSGYMKTFKKKASLKNEGWIFGVPQ